MAHLTYYQPDLAGAAAAGKALSASPIQTAPHRRAFGRDYPVERARTPRGTVEPVITRYYRRIRAALGSPRNRCFQTLQFGARLSKVSEHDYRQAPPIHGSESYKKNDSHNPWSIYRVVDPKNTTPNHTIILCTPRLFEKSV